MGSLGLLGVCFLIIVAAGVFSSKPKIEPVAGSSVPNSVNPTEAHQSQKQLTAEERKLIFIAWEVAYQEATRIAQRRVPKRTPELRRDVLKRHSDVWEKEWDRLIAPTLKRYGIEEDETDDIVIEGKLKHWPER